MQWTLGYMCLFQFWFPRSICQVVGLLGHMIVLFLSLQTINSGDDVEKSDPVYNVGGNAKWYSQNVFIKSSQLAPLLHLSSSYVLPLSSCLTRTVKDSQKWTLKVFFFIFICVNCNILFFKSQKHVVSAVIKQNST